MERCMERAGDDKCLSGVEAEIVCTVGCQDVSGGFHLLAVGLCRRGRRLLVELQWESATMGMARRGRVSCHCQIYSSIDG